MSHLRIAECEAARFNVFLAKLGQRRVVVGFELVRGVLGEQLPVVRASLDSSGGAMSCRFRSLWNCLKPGILQFLPERLVQAQYHRQLLVDPL